MAQSKKSKPKKHHKPPAKKHGKQADISQFRTQLDALGLKIIQVTADGNCFFRALADQLEGNEEQHKKYRDMVVQYISNHREDFEPFIEDDVPFDEYCQSMGKDGTWAGHMELQAASLVTRRNICIHKAMSPRWYIRNFIGQETSMIHLCYHDGEHYNSVRLKEDSCEGPAKPIIIKVDANISSADRNKKSTVNEFKAASSRSPFNIESVKLVMSGTGCQNIKKIEQVLHDVDGDVDAAIEFMIAEQDLDENINCNDDIQCDQNVNCEQSEEAPRDMTCESSGSNESSQSIQCHIVRHDKKEIAKDKECSCGSKKKHKACCSSAVGKASAPHSINNFAAHKVRKETKQSRKKEAGREETKQSKKQETKREQLPDMGALCI